ncbi:MAG: PLP-dependent aminotransferase family protein, partial [Oscillospiraceae bacterium]
TIPNFQNPTGLTMPLEKRKQVYALAVKYGVPILEDDPYGALRYYGEEIAPIKSFDTEGAVVYAGSFSKIMCPGMRVAFAIGAKELLAKMVIAKQCCDVHTNVWAQKVCNEILTKTDMTAHLSHLQNIYKEKCDLMVKEMQKYFSDKVKYTSPEGGMFIWVTLPENADVNAFVKKALEQKVAVVPGAAFLADDTKPCQSFRMNFSTESKENIVKGIKILGKLTYNFCK